MIRVALALYSVNAFTQTPTFPDPNDHTEKRRKDCVLVFPGFHVKYYMLKQQKFIFFFYILGG